MSHEHDHANAPPTPAAATPNAAPVLTGAKPLTSAFSIHAMDCPTEEGLLRKRLTGMPGVVELGVDLMRRQLSVTHTFATADPIIEAVSSLAMVAEPVIDGAPGEHLLVEAAQARESWWPLSIAGVPHRTTAERLRAEIQVRFGLREAPVAGSIPPIDFGAPDGAPAYLVKALVVAGNEARQDHPLLSQTTRAVGEPGIPVERAARSLSTTRVCASIFSPRPRAKSTRWWLPAVASTRDEARTAPRHSVALRRKTPRTQGFLPSRCRLATHALARAS